MPGVKLKVARDGYDVDTASDRNIALDSDKFLPKIFRVKRSTSTQSVAHGLTYPPRAIFLREMNDTPKKIGFVMSPWVTDDIPSIDSTNINFEIMSHYSDFTTGPYTSTNDTASITLLMLDPLGTPGVEPTPLSGDQPIVRVGGEDGDPDYKRKIHSYYDSLKVFSTGTLTLNVPLWNPGVGDTYNFVTNSYTHNLGYIPFFAPAAPLQMSITQYYSWYWQWHNRHVWATATEYLKDDSLTHGGTPYYCTVTHTSSASTEPGIGVDWASYWTIVFPGVPTDLDVNSLEDIKYVFGGAGGFTDEILEVYATATELVVNYHRVDGGFFFSFPAMTITIDYTIFYNRIDEDMNILDEY